MGGGDDIELPPTDPRLGGEQDSSALYVAAGTLIAERYQVEERVGVGGMGVVYRACDSRLGRDVAIKLLLDDTAEGQRRMLREATAMARLSHPNVVTAYDVGTWRGRVFLAMELVPG